MSETLTEPMPEVPALFAEEPPVIIDGVIPLSDLPPDADLMGDPPSRDLVESIRRNGVIVPVVLIGGRLEDGRRRVMASRAAGLKEIPYRGLPEGNFLTGEVGVSANTLRSENPWSDLLLIERMKGRGMSEKEVMQNTGLSRSTYEKRMKLKLLIPELAKGVMEKRVRSNVAEAAAVLPKETQARLAVVLAEKGKLSAPDVAEARRVKNEIAQTAFPDDLFQTPAYSAPPTEPTDWREAALRVIDQRLLPLIPAGANEEYDNMRGLIDAIGGSLSADLQRDKESGGGPDGD